MAGAEHESRERAAPPRRRTPRRRVIAIEPPGPARQATPPATTSLEIATLLHLAELDASLIGRESVGRALVHDQMAEERRGLGARISPEILEAYDRALRTGRQPAVVPLAGSVCTGCHMRLHSKLDHQIQKRRGVAACPHCLRLVYDPAWLDGR